MRRCFCQRGVTLVELLLSLSIASMLLVGFYQLVAVGFASRQEVDAQSRLVSDARFALSRMVGAIAASETLLIPMIDNPTTTLSENVRVKTVGENSGTAVLAVTLDPVADLDANGVADADNDGDGRVDEDLPADTTNDGEPGLRNFDDDGNGSTDFAFSSASDDDESNDLRRNEDPVNGLDDDGDGSIDEDPGADINNDGAPGVINVDDDGDGVIDEGDVDDDDEDGLVDEDWFDPVVFYLDGDRLVERRAVPWDTSGDNNVTGRDYVESTLIAGVAYLRFERIAKSPTQQQRVSIELTLEDDDGNTFSLATQVRLGAAR